jgi:hypothetical protein
MDLSSRQAFRVIGTGDKNQQLAKTQNAGWHKTSRMREK